MNPLLSRLIGPPQWTDFERLRQTVQGQTILVTGASFGIGEATALLLAKAGATVLLLARSAEKLEALAAQIRQTGGQAFVYPCDLYRLESIPALMANIQAQHPRIHTVILNAGKSIQRPLARSFERDDLQRSVALNYTGPVLMLNALVPQMLAHGGGQIVSVSTVSVKLPAVPRWAAYQSSKTGLDVWVRSLGTELHHLNLRTTSVYFPLVKTRMSAASKMFDRVPGLSTQQAARVLAYALVKKPQGLAPWWLWWLQGLGWLLAWPISRLLSLWEGLRKD